MALKPENVQGGVRAVLENASPAADYTIPTTAGKKAQVVIQNPNGDSIIFLYAAFSQATYDNSNISPPPTQFNVEESPPSTDTVITKTSTAGQQIVGIRIALPNTAEIIIEVLETPA